MYEIASDSDYSEPKDEFDNGKEEVNKTNKLY